MYILKPKFLFLHVLENFQKFQKTVLYVRGDVFIVMCTKFQVDTLENGVFRALERPKKATFRDISMQYHVFLFFVFILIWRVKHGSKVIFRVQDDKTT